MRSHISKSGHECSLAVKQAKEVIKDKLDYLTTRKIVWLYTNNRECSFQETVYHILVELHLPKTFTDVSFVKSNLPGAHCVQNSKLWKKVYISLL